MSKVMDFLKSYDYSVNLELMSSVLLFIILLAIISLFIWEFYKSISKRNLIKLSLSKYNTTNHPVANKLMATFLYLIEYIIIIPILIILWFAALSLVLLLIAEDSSVQQVLTISAIVVGASRVLSYFKGEIAKDLAKLFPFIALSVYILSLGKLTDFSTLISKALEVPFLLSDITSYIVAILLIEIILRFIFTIVDLWKSEEKALNQME